MIPKFQILGSSSSGNCGLIETADSRILIDVGFSGKRVRELLKRHGVDIESIDAIFLTHEHSDHSQGFRGLHKHKHLKWICNRDTYDAIDHPAKIKAKWSIFETGSRFLFRNIEVDAFSIPHDASDPVGYTFTFGGEDLFSPHRCIAWVLDLGYVTELVKEKTHNADTLVIEANYDSELLEMDTKRPWGVKQRIQSRHGHLSNTAVAEFVGSLNCPRLQEVYLAHISKDCNDTKAIKKAFHKELNGRKLAFNVQIFNPSTSECEPLVE